MPMTGLEGTWIRFHHSKLPVPVNKCSQCKIYISKDINLPQQKSPHKKHNNAQGPSCQGIAPSKLMCKITKIFDTVKC